MMSSKRLLIRSWGIIGLVATATMTPAGESPTYYKGNTHAHTLWSDGNDFPEMVVDYYHRNGYHFLALSDHNVMAEGHKWISHDEVVARQQGREGRVLDKYRARFGADWITETEENGQPGVVLKTLAEFRDEFEEPGSFLLIKGEEISSRSTSGPVHINAVNLERMISGIDDRSRTNIEILREVLRAAAAQEAALERPILTHVNHPNFKWALTAEDLAAVEEARFFEVFNGHPGINHLGSDDAPGDERIWDITNTIRLAEMDAAPMLGVATDDSHYYHGGNVSPGRGWIMVAAEKLEANALMRAMRRGDFYASTGVTLKHTTYDPEARELVVEIDGPAGVTYAAELIGTRLIRDEQNREVLGPIGEVMAIQSGRTVRFVVPEDALFARVTVTSSVLHPNPSWEGQFEQAWTQPVAW